MEPGEFQGTIGRYHWESTPWWPPPRRPPEGAPNIVLVVLDDVGFAQLGCFGSDLDTPVFDTLAARGLRYRNFHTTALCSPTRSCLLTGRNHHANGMGRITDLATGFPGYDGCIPKANALPLGDPRAARLRGVGHRQVAPHTGRRAEPGGAARPVAARPRLRAVLRVLRRRDAPERARARPRQPLRRRAARRERRLPPHRGPRRSRDRVRARPPAGRRGQAVLRVPVPGCMSLAAPRATRVDRALPRPLRRRVGRVARTGARAPDRDGVAAVAHGALGAAGVGSGVGGPHRRRTPGLRALHGGVRGLPVARGPPCRPVPRRAGGHRRSRQHGRDRGVRQRREQRRRRARIVERRTRRGTARRAPPKRRCRSSTRSVARAGTTTTRGAGPSRATRRSAVGSARCTKAVSPIR